MLFNSWGYLLFLLVAVPLHWALGDARTRVWLLAAASVLFYAMWRWEFTLLVVFSACVDFVAAGQIAASDRASTRKRWLLLSLTINLGLLAVFKYTYFAWDNLRALGAAWGQAPPTLQSLGVSIVLPLGISFYTFQTISYTIDVYRGVAQPLQRFSTFLCYVTFWPQLIAGPVLRVGEVAPQLEAERRFSADDLTAGASRILIGLFKKVVLADSLATFVDAAFALDPASLNALDVWVASFLFGFQIYFDFAGYSDVAIGSARIALMNNDLRRVPFLIQLSRASRGVVTQNLVVGIALLGSGLALAGAGHLTPIWAILLHNFGSLFVVFNSARLIRLGEDL